MKERFFWIVFCCLLLIAAFSTGWTLVKASIELDALKAMPPKTVIETVTREITTPCPSEPITTVVMSGFGPIAIHIRPGDIDLAIKQKHEAIKEIEKGRMENKPTKSRKRQKRLPDRKDI